LVKPRGDEDEHQQRVEQRLCLGVAEAQRRCALTIDVPRALQMLEGASPRARYDSPCACTLKPAWSYAQIARAVGIGKGTVGKFVVLG